MAPSVVQSAPAGILAVNGDGKQDLAIVDFNTTTEVFLGNGDGTFQPGQVLSAGGLSLDDKADFNGDRALDLVQTNPHPIKPLDEF